MNTSTNANGVKTYRGRTLEEVLPIIKSELGSEAVIVRQRDGLMGGVGGFFQRPCIEVDARPPAAPAPSPRRFDAYDDSDAIAPEPGPAEFEPFATEPDPGELFGPVRDPATAEGLASPAIREMLRQAAPFAEQLTAAAAGQENSVEEPAPQPPPFEVRDPEPSPRQQLPETHPQPGRPPVAGATEERLVAAGIAPALAAELVAETVSHRLPFSSPRSFKRLAREALAARIGTAPAVNGRGRSLAFAGPGGSGKTHCVGQLAAAYAERSDLPVVVLSLRPADGGAALRRLLEPHGVGVQTADSPHELRARVAGALGHALVVVDTPAVTLTSPAEVASLAGDLGALGLDEVHLALPATFSSAAAEELLERAGALGADRVALTHLDATARIGSLLDLLISSGRRISYTATAAGLEPVEPASLAATVLP